MSKLFDEPGGATNLGALVEDGCWSTGGRRALMDMCPTILLEHEDSIRKRVAGKAISTPFDGSRVTAPAEVVLFRFLEDWDIVQLCVSVKLLAKNPMERKCAWLSWSNMAFLATVFMARPETAHQRTGKP